MDIYGGVVVCCQWKAKVGRLFQLLCNNLNHSGDSLQACDLFFSKMVFIRTFGNGKQYLHKHLQYLSEAQTLTLFLPPLQVCQVNLGSQALRTQFWRGAQSPWAAAALAANPLPGSAGTEETKSWKVRECVCQDLCEQSVLKDLVCACNQFVQELATVYSIFCLSDYVCVTQHRLCVRSSGAHWVVATFPAGLQCVLNLCICVCVWERAQVWKHMYTAVASVCMYECSLMSSSCKHMYVFRKYACAYFYCTVTVDTEFNCMCVYMCVCHQLSCSISPTGSSTAETRI